MTDVVSVDEQFAALAEQGKAYLRKYALSLRGQPILIDADWRVAMERASDAATRGVTADRRVVAFKVYDTLFPMIDEVRVIQAAGDPDGDGPFVSTLSKEIVALLEIALDNRLPFSVEVARGRIERTLAGLRGGSGSGEAIRFVLPILSDRIADLADHQPGEKLSIDELDARHALFLRAKRLEQHEAEMKDVFYDILERDRAFYAEWSATSASASL